MSSPFFASRPPRSILVVVTRRIGDVLLTTPIVRSLKAKWPDTPIDMLVFRGTEGVLEGNPDVRRVIAVAQRARFAERFADARRIWRRYDLACAAVSSDRPRFYTWFAGKKRVGLVDPERVNWLTRFMLTGTALNQHGSVHTVNSTLALATVLGIPPIPQVVPPAVVDEAQRARLEGRLGYVPSRQPLIALHPYPMFAYKRWHVDGWARLIDWLRERGFAIVLTGGPAQDERDYAQQVANVAGGAVINLVGQLSLAESAEVMRMAKLFVGPDTGATHIAAATGTPTIALFGPSDPVRWGPWPCGWPAGVDPWALRGSARHGNVYLLQGEGACVPCRAEGCFRHIESPSECLTGLDVRRVIAAAAEMLALQ
ncbi:glycosyltransferase family 9 protein [Trinickia soli]|uniref:glycosyltransferase family 9 protein n=1 Tax=Trinickia soli TaxID=380675 RepID=UPI003FA34E77